MLSYHPLLVMRLTKNLFQSLIRKYCQNCPPLISFMFNSVLFRKFRHLFLTHSNKSPYFVFFLENWRAILRTLHIPLQFLSNFGSPNSEGVCRLFRPAWYFLRKSTLGLRPGRPNIDHLRVPVKNKWPKYSILIVSEPLSPSHTQALSNILNLTYISLKHWPNGLETETIIFWIQKFFFVFKIS